jgi:hypothetical protein
MLYQVHLARVEFQLTKLVLIGTDWELVHLGQEKQIEELPDLPR